MRAARRQLREAKKVRVKHRSKGGVSNFGSPLFYCGGPGPEIVTFPHFGCKTVAGTLKRFTLQVKSNPDSDSLAYPNRINSELAKGFIVNLIVDQATKEVTQNELGQTVTTFKFEG